jgi:hypothetical protein
MGVWNHPDDGPVFGSGYGLLGFYISDDCHQNEFSRSSLGVSYEIGPDIGDYALFGQKWFRVDSGFD